MLVLQSVVRTARKEHKCHECSRVIAPKESYLIETLLFEGRISRHKTCLDCKSLRDNFFQDGWYYEEVRNMLLRHIRDSDGDISESCIAALTPVAREYVCSVIEDMNQDDEEDDV